MAGAAVHSSIFAVTGREGRDYDKIWNKERDESRLPTARARSPTNSRGARQVGDRIRVDSAMRYRRSIEIHSLPRRWPTRTADQRLLVPLYPRYPRRTPTVYDELSARCRRCTSSQRYVFPRLYAQLRLYLSALAASLDAELAKLNSSRT